MEMKSLRRIGTAALLILVVLFSCSFTVGYNPKLYDIGRAMNTIKELTSRDFNGRAAGTQYGQKTEEYVAAKFKEAGLKPGGNENSYFQRFQGVSGNPSGDYILEVIQDGKVIKTYKYGVDYRYFTNMSYGGETISRGVELNPAFANIKEVSNGEIGLMKNTPSTSSAQPFADLYNAGYRGLIVAREGAMTRVKGQSGYPDQSAASRLPRVSVTPEILDELINYSNKGYKIHLKAGFEVKNYTARNVIGILKSQKPSDKYLIISAHMDHLAPDPDGAYFPGALDNASGTASIIEIARTLINQPVKPDINIVFIAFSGEEVMLDGSTYYVKNPIYKLKNTRVINLDMIGAKNSMPISIVTSGTGSRYENEADIKDEMIDLAKNDNYRYEALSEGASDHYPFSRVGVPAVTLIDFEKVVYHVPEDTIENIGVDNLNRAVRITMEAIGKEAYQNEKSGVPVWVCAAGIVLVVSSAAVVFLYIRKKKAA
jgi:Predicted aminopeptidases